MTTYSDLPPIVRAGNPATSQLAATEITESGERQTLMRLALRHVRGHPGQTAGEIGDGTGLGHMRVERRLSDLKNKGLLTQGNHRQWHGKAQVTWWLVEEQLQLL